MSNSQCEHCLTAHTQRGLCGTFSATHIEEQEALTVDGTTIGESRIEKTNPLGKFTLAEDMRCSRVNFSPRPYCLIRTRPHPASGSRLFRRRQKVGGYARANGSRSQTRSASVADRLLQFAGGQRRTRVRILWLYAVFTAIHAANAFARHTKHAIKSAEFHAIEQRRPIRQVFQDACVFVDGGPNLAPNKSAQIWTIVREQGPSRLKETKGHHQRVCFIFRHKIVEEVILRHASSRPAGLVQ